MKFSCFSRAQKDDPDFKREYVKGEPDSIRKSFERAVAEKDIQHVDYIFSKYGDHLINA